MDSTLPPARPWSRRELANLGKFIQGQEIPADSVPPYDDVMAWYNDIATWVQTNIEAMDWTPLLGAAVPSLVSRPKTIDTLRQKLLRTPNMQLATVQDIAGVRFEAEMSLDEQDAVAEAIAARFGHGPDSIHDLREDPHSGYRAVHIWLRFEGSGRAEVQVRTHLQGQWANLYERAADVYGRQIRYDESAKDEQAQGVVDQLITLSTSGIARMEHVRNRLGRLRLMDDDARRGIIPGPPSNGASVSESHRSSRNSERQLMESMERMKDLFNLMQRAEEMA